MFRSQFFDHLQGVVLRASAITTFSACLRRLFGTTYSHIPNKQLDDANKHRSSNSSKHEGRRSEDGQTIVTETCRVLIDVFYKHF